MRKKGFTLIELLLVLALLSIMLGFLVLSLRQHAENARINKASLEIEQVLQAAITYNANNGKWPENNFIQPCKPDLKSDFVENYLPNNQTQSSLGYYYCWGAKGSNNQIFAVILEAPDKSRNFARRLAAHLPNAIITDDPNSSSTNPDCPDADKPCYVRTEVAANTNTDQAAKMFIVGMGNCAKGAEAANVPDQENCKADILPQGQTEIFHITFPACTGNYEAKISASPNFMTMPGMGKFPGWSFKGYVFMRSQAIVQACEIKNGQETCQLNLQIQVCANAQCDALDILQTDNYKGTATVGASYVVACKMKDKSQAKMFL